MDADDSRKVIYCPDVTGAVRDGELMVGHTYALTYVPGHYDRTATISETEQI